MNIITSNTVFLSILKREIDSFHYASLEDKKDILIELNRYCEERINQITDQLNAEFQTHNDEG